MEEIAKGFLGFLLILILVFTGIGIVSATMDANNAERFVSSCASQIEAANYSGDVIQKCIDDASDKKRNYTLDVKPVDTDNDGHTDLAELTLHYKYTVPILNKDGVEHTARTYAR